MKGSSATRVPFGDWMRNAAWPSQVTLPPKFFLVPTLVSPVVVRGAGHPAEAVDELLLRPQGRHVPFRGARESGELGAELGVEFLGRITHHLETAALFGPVRP